MYLGIDGCPAGWYVVRATHPGGEIAGKVYAEFADVLRECASDTVIAIDIPIGLLAAGTRRCDELARRALAPRRGSSVFPAPLRPVLGVATHREASALSREIHGKGMSIQSFAITRKVQEIDIALQDAPERAQRVHEVHPELCFAKLNDGEPMTFSKKSASGRDERLRHLGRIFGDAPARLVAERPRKQVGADDVLDAMVALWSALRIGREEHACLPAVPDLDSRGRRMAIHC